MVILAVATICLFSVDCAVALRQFMIDVASLRFALAIVIAISLDCRRRAAADIIYSSQPPSTTIIEEHFMSMRYPLVIEDPPTWMISAMEMNK